ncbi:NAD kinase [Schaalia sp. 19OD2882]|uniref:NAD kinase n=1 Tax=Schaalia sp. 19OD2882 TaxID=2794089 RepID=UPI001C1F1675|nr:NAD kinase [Schaalia sp. 19OD2882]QWW18761.1 NAD kinase [Schaalia sp. 19OD2882]
MTRTVMLVRHEKRPDTHEPALIARRELEACGVRVVDQTHDSTIDVVLALGGDGTMLAAVALARRSAAPVLGVNLGHMGFLAEDPDNGIPDIARRIAKGEFTVDERMTLDVDIHLPDGSVVHDWALNEAVLIHTDVAHPVHMLLGIDGQAVSTYGADGMILATPTGSTAYSFSAGGPVVWPDTEAVLIAPLAAHGLFTRPLVVGPSSRIEVEVLEDTWVAPEVWCDGLRATRTPAGSRVVATVGTHPAHLVRLDETPFSTRLVHKFHLPVRGWRAGDARRPS